jgi:hypothetical protein
LNEISKRWPSSPVTSFQSYLVETDLGEAARRLERLAARREAVLREQRRGEAGAAAAPGWNGLVMVPNCSRMPTGCEAAMPSAMAVLFSSRLEQARARRRRRRACPWTR